MRVQLQKSLLTLLFSKQLLNFGTGKIILHGNIQCIKLSDNFCYMRATKDALIESVFHELHANYINMHGYMN